MLKNHVINIEPKQEYLIKPLNNKDIWTYKDIKEAGGEADQFIHLQNIRFASEGFCRDNCFCEELWKNDKEDLPCGFCHSFFKWFPTLQISGALIKNGIKKDK